ncbi:MAG TPA: RdgB/HAM1 family non-canonical purine NTP pyrophosphatase [Candidatus Marinimicrobia bacterium]|nr:RdgB/HAM1 family non-canonical purine NTP pyrophosphatase [Candidatus Neomarinimicrobiota bacterium]
MKLLISSNNQDKIKEIKSIFQLPGVELLTLADFPGAPDVVEDGNTLYENALKKASMLCEFSGLPTIADDTGLEVDSLGGHPGVYSARYAGENASYNDNIEKLIREIQKVPENRRTARFRTVAVFYHPELILRAEGTIEGYILSERSGSNGFGYDPIFFVPIRNKTLAEMSAAEKNAISHRGQAFSRLYQLLQKEFPSLINI